MHYTMMFTGTVFGVEELNSDVNKWCEYMRTVHTVFEITSTTSSMNEYKYVLVLAYKISD